MSYSVQPLESQLQAARQRDDHATTAQLLWKLAQHDLQRDDVPMALSRLLESYELNQRIGRLDGVCAVGLVVGQMLASGGQWQSGREVLVEVREGFRKLGQPRGQQQAEKLIAKIDADNATLN